MKTAAEAIEAGRVARLGGFLATLQHATRRAQLQHLLNTAGWSAALEALTRIELAAYQVHLLSSEFWPRGQEVRR